VHPSPTADAQCALEQAIADHRENLRRNNASARTEQPEAPQDSNQKIQQEMEYCDELLKDTESHIFAQVLESSMREGAPHALKVARDTIDPVRASSAVQPLDRHARGAIDAVLVRTHGTSVLSDLEKLFKRTIQIAKNAIAEEQAINAAYDSRVEQRTEESRQDGHRQQHTPDRNGAGCSTHTGSEGGRAAGLGGRGLHNQD
jgi:hypothetical protein